jgi:biopolymer transport protein ExbD
VDELLEAWGQTDNVVNFLRIFFIMLSFFNFRARSLRGDANIKVPTASSPGECIISK